MRIGFNTRFLLKNKMEGFGWFTYETLKRISQQHPEHEFVFFFDRKYDSKFLFSDNITPVVLYPPTRHPILQVIWFDYCIPKALKRYKCDAFVSTDGYVSLKTNLPQLTVIHDLNFEHNPSDLPPYIARFFQKRFPKFAQKATILCTVSNFSKEDIVNTYGVSPDKIHVTYNGVSPHFQPISSDEKNTVKKIYTQGKPYILCVGAIHKRKNIQRLIAAFQQLKAEENIQHHLLIVGEPMWNKQQIKVNPQTHSSIHFTGHVSHDALVNIMGGAVCLAFVSYFEGFGIPIVEAMKSGIPVLAGNKTALPEVGGDAALYCDPYSVSSIKKQLNKIITNQPLRDTLIKKGMKRAEFFSWDTTANKLWNAIEKLF